MDDTQDIPSGSNQAASPTEKATTQETEVNTTTEIGKESEAKAANGYEGKEFVEFSPEQQKRINTLTKKIGYSERAIQERDDIMRQQFELINELRQGQGQIVAHLQQTNFVETESQLKTQRKEAYARGDVDAVDTINDRLADIKLEKKLQEKQSKGQPRQAAMAPVGDPVQLAVQRGDISHSDADVFQDWQNETDTNGNLLRPWTNERHAKHGRAAGIGKAVFSDPELQGKPFGERLKEIDKMMGVMPRQAGQGVMPAGNLTGNAKTSNVKLSSWAENIAVRTNFAGKGKSRAEHIDAYRKQIAETRGVR